MEFDVINGKVVERRSKPFIEFYIHPALDKAASVKEGRRVHKDAVYIKIKAAGAKDSVSRRATEQDIANHPSEYAKLEQSPQESGTDVGLIIPSTADLADVKALGIHTVEKLATIDVLPESLKQYQAKAKAFIKLTETQDASDIEGQGQGAAVNH